MRVRLPAEQHLEEVPGVVRQPIDLRKAALQPARKEVDRPRKAVHLREQRHEKGAYRAEGAPIAGRAWTEDAEGEQTNDRGSDHDQEPESGGGSAFGR